ncbi:MAG: hypothetical protein JWL95_1217, partial [Gemmatimonadetes bacterium]|nr:hypothetical protein [Gemmatimonadota bacterium]
MLHVLLESNSARTRRIGGTLTSTLVHGAIIAGAVALTVQGPVEASPPPKPPKITYVIIPARPEVPTEPHTRPPRGPELTLAVPPAPVTIQFVDPKTPVVDIVSPSMPVSAGAEIGPALPAAGPGSLIGLGGP